MASVIDIGPLSWVKSEIDSSLDRARASLKAFSVDHADTKSLKAAQTHLHQAYGAVQIVGLHGVSRFFEETERVVAELEMGKVAASPDTFDALERATQAIAKYLSELLDGMPDQPLRLYPLHKELAGLRGIKDASEADLFFPDLSLQPPPRDDHPVRLSAEEMGTYMRGQRTRFQRGFLKWLKEPGDEASLGDMLAAVDGIESTQLVPAQRAFWWATGAFYQALSAGALRPDPGIKLLSSKIEQQMKRMTDGAVAVPERLMREVLYWIAKAPLSDSSGSERVREAQQAFRLEGALPTAERESDPSQRAPAAKLLHEQISAAKDAWNRFASGGDASLAVFAKLVDTIQGGADALGSPDFGSLAQELSKIAAYLVTHTGKMSESIGMEVATALLLTENAVENHARLSPEFNAQARVMLARLRASAFGTQDPDVTLNLPLIDDMTRRAQERLAIDGAVAEMQANLHKIEQALDTYFRDPSQPAELVAIEPAIHQVSGALAMLGEEEAGAALVRCEEKIRGFAQATTRPDLHEFEEIAQILSGLGFYIDALRHGKADFAVAMQPIGAAVPPARQVPEAEEQAEAEEALDITPPIEAPSAEAERLRDQSDEKIDEELLAIFLEEAVGVLETISHSLAVCRSQPSNLGELTAIRRGFHTLKGSGRMVGLMRLGEAAWAVEQVMNLWQQEERVADTNLFSLIEFAHGAFVEWVACLQGGRPQPDAQRIVELAEQVKRSESPKPLPDAPILREPPALAPPSLPEQAPTPVEEGVKIGGLAISASLFTVFTNEARQHLETLERELAQAAAGRTPGVREELVRAAHTLAGICGTVQLNAMHHLGSAFEGALLRLKNRATPMTPEELALAHDSIQALKLMYEGVLERALPGAATKLIARLGAITGEAARLTVQEEEDSPAHSSEVALEREPDEPEERRQRRLEDEIDPQLLPIFLEEANELVPQVGELLRTWRAEPVNFEPARALQRALHTLKGSSRMAGVMGLGELTHNMETRVENAIALNLTPGQFFDDLDVSYDRIGLLLERVQQPDMSEQAEAPRAGETTAAVGAPVATPAPTVQREEAKVHAMMRVRADALEKLVNEAGEIAITRTRVETEMHGLKAALLELTENVARLRRELREIEIAAESQLASRMHGSTEKDKQFDPLEFDRFTRFQELTRMMAESVNDVSTVQQTLNKVVDDTDSALAAQARLNRELQQDLMRIRMVPIGSIVERLHRIVRQTSKELGKRANLDIRGINVELDRSALERITGPLEHLLRNAITHGLELPEARVAQGKAAMGEISLEIRQEGNEVTLILADDGAGLDLERIRAKAISQGLLDPSQARTDQQLAELVFTPGLSTAETVTELAGRGVGLDVVMSEVSGLGGRIELAFTPAQGTRFTIRLPLTTAVIQAVLVKIGNRTYALPSVMVEQVQQMRQEVLEKARAAGAIEWAGRRYPLHHLPSLLGEAASAQVAGARRYSPVLLVRSGVEAVAVEVDEMIGNQEVVVKNIGPQLARVPGIAGATVLGTGEIVLILNPVPLAARPASAHQVVTSPHVRPLAVPSEPRIMVVDDSLTVRKITGRLLTREGYLVITARDGVEALELLAEAVPDVMLVDVEMPRMDGFDLTRNVRADARLKDVPIIMITSRTADKHRNYAMELGVNVFLGKPYQEDDLLRQIAGFIGPS
jgi:chemosensory pili system protein ChpA (sensor histidine kinase/response regulator)